MNRIEQVLLSLAIFAELLGMKCGPLCSSDFPIFSDQHSFSCTLDTKFCLHAAGGIYAPQKSFNLGGNIKISNSSAQKYGGAVLRSSSWGLWQDFEMAVGSGRSTLGSENRKELKRFPKISIISIDVGDKA